MKSRLIDHWLVNNAGRQPWCGGRGVSGVSSVLVEGGVCLWGEQGGGVVRGSPGPINGGRGELWGYRVGGNHEGC